MDQIAKETLPVSLEEEMRRSYLDYAMSVIVGRALPDVRDGLKPVHRRILYAMHEANNVWNRPYVKCARVVGAHPPRADAGRRSRIVAAEPAKRDGRRRGAQIGQSVRRPGARPGRAGRDDRPRRLNDPIVAS